MLLWEETLCNAYPTLFGTLKVLNKYLAHCKCSKTLPVSALQSFNLWTRDFLTLKTVWALHCACPKWQRKNSQGLQVSVPWVDLGSPIMTSTAMGAGLHSDLEQLPDLTVPFSNHSDPLGIKEVSPLPPMPSRVKSKFLMASPKPRLPNAETPAS